MCLTKYVRVHIYYVRFIFTYICTSVYVCIYACVGMYICLYMYSYTYVCTYVHTVIGYSSMYVNMAEEKTPCGVHARI